MDATSVPVFANRLSAGRNRKHLALLARRAHVDRDCLPEVAASAPGLVAVGSAQPVFPGSVPRIAQVSGYMPEGHAVRIPGCCCSVASTGAKCPSIELSGARRWPHGIAAQTRS